MLLLVIACKNWLEQLLWRVIRNFSTYYRFAASHWEWVFAKCLFRLHDILILDVSSPQDRTLIWHSIRRLGRRKGIEEWSKHVCEEETVSHQSNQGENNFWQAVVKVMLVEMVFWVSKSNPVSLKGGCKKFVVLSFMECSGCGQLELKSLTMNSNSYQFSWWKKEYKKCPEKPLKPAGSIIYLLSYAQHVWNKFKLTTSTDLCEGPTYKCRGVVRHPLYHITRGNPTDYPSWS